MNTPKYKLILIPTMQPAKAGDLFIDGVNNLKIATVDCQEGKLQILAIINEEQIAEKSLQEYIGVPLYDRFNDHIVTISPSMIGKDYSENGIFSVVASNISSITPLCLISPEKVNDLVAHCNIHGRSPLPKISTNPTRVIGKYIYFDILDNVATNVQEPQHAFNEATLRSELAKTWGEHGAHMEVFDRMLAKQNREQDLATFACRVFDRNFHKDMSFKKRAQLMAAEQSVKYALTPEGQNRCSNCGMKVYHPIHFTEDGKPTVWTELSNEIKHFCDSNNYTDKKVFEVMPFIITAFENNPLYNLAKV